MNTRTLYEVTDGINSFFGITKSELSHLRTRLKDNLRYQEKRNQRFYSALSKNFGGFQIKALDVGDKATMVSIRNKLIVQARNKGNSLNYIPRKK